MKRLFLLLLLVGSLVSASVRAQGNKLLRLYVLDCGAIEVLNLAVFQPALGAGVVKNLAVSCYLAVHPQRGSLLFDTGIGDSYVGKPKTLIQGFANFSASKALAVQLEQIGHPPSTINFLALSHLHQDHTGNSRLFPQATHLIQAEEWEAGFESPNAAALVGDPALVESLRNNPTRKLKGDFDVFGDGSVWLKRTPGHTPGHQSLFVRLSSGTNVFLSGDLAHYTENWEQRNVPGFNFDEGASVRSMNDVQRFLVENKAVLWIGHDLEQSSGLRHAPGFYE